MMRRLAALLILLLLLMACGAPLAAGRLLLAEPPAPGVLRVGFGGESRAPMSSLEDGQPRGERCSRWWAGQLYCTQHRGFVTTRQPIAGSNTAAPSRACACRV